MAKRFYPTVPDRTIKVGDKVRSFDFVGNTECYFVGTVIAITPMQQYDIKVDYQVWEGKKAKTNYCDRVVPPLNGLDGIFGLTRGVQRILEGEQA